MQISDGSRRRFPSLRKALDFMLSPFTRARFGNEK